MRKWSERKKKCVSTENWRQTVGKSPKRTRQKKREKKDICKSFDSIVGSFFVSTHHQFPMDVKSLFAPKSSDSATACSPSVVSLTTSPKS